MRLFTAVNFDRETKEYLTEASLHLQREGIDGRYTRPENFHLTLIFLGEQSPSRVPAVKRAMEEAAAGMTPFDLSVEGIGSFRGGIVWAGVKTCPPLTKVWRRLSDALAKEDFEFRAENYRPHLTMCRDAQYKGRLPEIELTKQIHVPEISLMKSEFTGGRLVYTEIETVPLGEKNETERH